MTGVLRAGGLLHKHATTRSEGISSSHTIYKDPRYSVPCNLFTRDATCGYAASTEPLRTAQLPYFTDANLLAITNVN